jgi:DNA-binding NarL/FixJ family response regulator
MSTPESNELKVVMIASGAIATLIRRSLAGEDVEVTAVARAVDDMDPVAAAAADVAVLHLPTGEAASRITALRSLAPIPRLVAIAQSLGVRALRGLLDLGVDAVVLEGDAPRALGPAIRSAYAGQLSIPGSLRHTLVTPVLSTREKQVLGLVVLGLANAEIARKLHLAESTVKSHLSSAFTKLGARSRSEATALILDPATGLGPGILTIATDR